MRGRQRRYRSPAHALSRHASRHCWGTAANIYRIGDTWLDSRERSRKYADIARRVIPGVWIAYGPEDGQPTTTCTRTSATRCSSGAQAERRCVGEAS